MQMWSPGSERTRFGLYLGDRHGRASQGGWHASWSASGAGAWRCARTPEWHGMALGGRENGAKGDERWGSARLRGGTFENLGGCG